MSTSSLSSASVYLASALIFVLAIYLASPAQARRKLSLFPSALVHFFLSTDFHYNAPPPLPAAGLHTFTRRRRVLFIRHGESVWNVMFNRGFLTAKFVPNLVRGLFSEFQLLPTSDSVFIDSPLSSVGIAQALSLRAFIDTCSPEDPAGAIATLLRSPDVPIIASNLRRAVSTAAISLSSRLLKHKQDKVIIHNCMQEITRNFDGHTITPARHAPGPGMSELSVPELEPVIERIFRAGKIDGDLNKGQKELFGSALNRFQQFVRVVFDETQSNTVIAVGHSLWLREFLRVHLPKEARGHLAAKKKLVNCGVVSFDLLELREGVVGVDPDSVTIVYGGFEGVKGDVLAQSLAVFLIAMENVHPGGSNRPLLSLETKVKTLEERLHRVGVTEETKLQTIGEHLLRTEEAMANERLADELMDERLLKDVQLLSTGATADLGSLRQQRKETEGRIERQATQRATALIEEFRREAKKADRDEQVTAFDQLGQELPRLGHSIEQVKIDRKASGSKLEMAVCEELEKMAGSVDVEKRIRVQQQNTLMHTMESFAARIEEEIAQLKAARHSSVEHLLGMLEEACARTEAKVQLKVSRAPL